MSRIRKKVVKSCSVLMLNGRQVKVGMYADGTYIVGLSRPIDHTSLNRGKPVTTATSGRVRNHLVSKFRCSEEAMEALTFALSEVRRIKAGQHRRVKGPRQLSTGNVRSHLFTQVVESATATT